MKVLYYAHGWHLAHRERPLVDQAFEAWKYGPVIPAVYEAFKGNGKHHLKTRARRFNVIDHCYLEIDDPIDSDVQELLRNVFDAHIHTTAYDLSRSTHLNGSPWDVVWNAPHGQVNIGMKISNGQIQQWFISSRVPEPPH
jgi:uncharacterized phage-associated protein